MFEDTVATLRANANPEYLNAIVHAFPNTDAIEPRHTLDALLWPDLSANEDTRRAQLPEVLAQYQDTLGSFIRRYNDLRSRGLGALSNFDIGIAYQGCGPERGLAQALTAVVNHIALTRAQLLWLLGEQDRLALPQLALF
jgi:hypothetical protein